MNPEMQVVVHISPESTLRVFLLSARQGQRYVEIFWTGASLFGGRFVFSIKWIQLT